MFAVVSQCSTPSKTTSLEMAAVQ